ncbi:MAG: hypothetical protein LBS80_02930 [Tannerella sp.]|jgi:3-hydroxyacyl-[acyl-carrier-protein] dehydratase|nr:hypothetical protein [Tannerella sp.]
MLNNTLFTIISALTEADTTNYRLVLHPSHDIFQSHFIDNPILPGACIVQIAKELAQESCRNKVLNEGKSFLDDGKSFLITKIKNTKFLAVINPSEHSEITVIIKLTFQEDGYVAVSALFLDAGLIFAKANLVLQPTPIADITTSSAQIP